jgi:hypothetical protein
MSSTLLSSSHCHFFCSAACHIVSDNEETLRARKRLTTTRCTAIGSYDSSPTKYKLNEEHFDYVFFLASRDRHPEFTKDQNLYKLQKYSRSKLLVNHAVWLTSSAELYLFVIRWRNSDYNSALFQWTVDKGLA